MLEILLIAVAFQVDVEENLEEVHEAHVEAATGDRFRPWKKNYFLMVWNPDLSGLPSPATGGENLDVETNFQISLRSEITRDLLIDGWSGHIGYTANSFWQMFDTDDSAPFRATDHTPEIFGETRHFDGHWLLRVAPAQHQSNGESGANSRSWNRSYLEGIWHSDPNTLQPKSFAFSELQEVRGTRVALKVWEEWGIDEDNNADIADYYGHFELNADWYSDFLGRSALSGMLRNSFGEGNRTTFSVAWSFDASDEIRVLLQFYSGYGLNLLDYDRHQQSIGIGLEISP